MIAGRYATSIFENLDEFYTEILAIEIIVAIEV